MHPRKDDPPRASLFPLASHVMQPSGHRIPTVSHPFTIQMPPSGDPMMIKTPDRSPHAHHPGHGSTLPPLAELLKGATDEGSFSQRPPHSSIVQMSPQPSLMSPNNMPLFLQPPPSCNAQQPQSGSPSPAPGPMWKRPSTPQTQAPAPAAPASRPLSTVHSLLSNSMPSPPPSPASLAEKKRLRSLSETHTASSPLNSFQFSPMANPRSSAPSPLSSSAITLSRPGYGPGAQWDTQQQQQQHQQRPDRTWAQDMSISNSPAASSPRQPDLLQQARMISDEMQRSVRHFLEVTQPPGPTSPPSPLIAPSSPSMNSTASWPASQGITVHVSGAQAPVVGASRIQVPSAGPPSLRPPSSSTPIVLHDPSPPPDDADSGNNKKRRTWNPRLDHGASAFAPRPSHAHSPPVPRPAPRRAHKRSESYPSITISSAAPLPISSIPDTIIDDDDEREQEEVAEGLFNLARDLVIGTRDGFMRKA